MDVRLSRGWALGTGAGHLPAPAAPWLLGLSLSAVVHAGLVLSLGSVTAQGRGRDEQRESFVRLRVAPAAMVTSALVPAAEDPVASDPPEEKVAARVVSPPAEAPPVRQAVRARAVSRSRNAMLEERARKRPVEPPVAAAVASAPSASLVSRASPSMSSAVASPGAVPENAGAPDFSRADDGWLTPLLEDVRRRIEEVRHYPRPARRLGMEGTVLLRVFLAQGGEVRRWELARPSGHDLLDQAALDAAHAVRSVRPGSSARVPRDLSVVVPVRFSLQGDSGAP